MNIERGRSRFTPAKSKAENAITPQAVLDTLKSGVFSGHEMTKPAAATSDSTIDLMLSVRGENGQATVFSPTIDVLKLVTQSEKIGAARDVVQIDVALMRLVETNPNDIETMVAATTFAFLRDDIDSAEKRLTKLSEVVAGREPQQDDVVLWLVARLALAKETTRDIGRKLADRAVAAAEIGGPWKPAILRERNNIANDKRLSGEKPDFNGSWTVESYQYQGRTFWKDITLLIKRIDDQVTLNWLVSTSLAAKANQKNISVYTINSSTTPCQIDEQGEQGLKGIYHLNGDTLRICLATERPATFEPKSTGDRRVIVLKREEPTHLQVDSGLLAVLQDYQVRAVEDPLQILRPKLIPQDVEHDRLGWNRVKAVTFLNKGGGYPVLGSLKPLLQDPKVVAELSDEIEELIEQHKNWKAGKAILCFLQAESGNHVRSAELLQEILDDAQKHPIPGDAAWGLGLVLQNRDPELDRLVMQLYRHGQETMSWVYARRSSPLADLARLTAKYGEKEKARDLLLRMSESYYDVDSPAPTISCPYTDSCTKCHKRERNFYDFTYMAGQLTDLGYPIDGYMALGRIDSSFQGAFSGDSQWFREKLGRDLSNERKEFDGAKAKVIQGLDASAILQGLELGSFRGDSNQPFEFLLTIRGRRNKQILFSPIIEVLKLAVESKESNSAKDIAELDRRLVTLSKQHPKSIEAGIAATVFAFLRNDLDSAKGRLQTLQAITDSKSDGTVLWLAARYALKFDETVAAGKALAEHAVRAADRSDNPRLKQAILRERRELLPEEP